MKILMSALVLNGSRSGYRRIIKNLLLYYSTHSEALEIVVLFQRSGFESIEIDPDSLGKNIKIIVLENFNSKWLRGLAEQALVPYYALINQVNWIFMPATFGVAIPLKPVLTFIHTNTNFKLDVKLRGRSKWQQLAHSFLVRLTSITSKRLIFTSDQTYKEYCTHRNKNFPHLIVGNGLFANNDIFKYVLPRPLNPRQYFLSVSQIYRLKNFDSLIKAFIRLKSTKNLPSEIALVIVGTIQEYDYYEELLLLASGRNDIVFMHDVSDGALSHLYKNAKGYCFFSYFEGYSLTPAEALLSGINIAISNIPTHKEIYENLPIYADPSNIDSISDAIISLNTRALLDTNSFDYLRLKEKLSFEYFIKRFETFLQKEIS
jgi:glycosyltransferase involved in cell wall biosynthesis